MECNKIIKPEMKMPVTLEEAAAKLAVLHDTGCVYPHDSERIQAVSEFVKIDDRTGIFHCCGIQMDYRVVTEEKKRIQKRIDREALSVGYMS
jgi:Fe-S oxidoreductase